MNTRIDVQMTLEATQANTLEHCLREQLLTALLAAQKATLLALVAAQREPRQ